MKKFALFQIEKCCDFAKLKKQTKTAASKEISVGKPGHEAVYEVFWSRTTPKRELFRIEIGRSFDGQLVRTWTYGIAEEGDFNGDGVPDYSWYGGDDTGQEFYLFLSSGTGYKRIDLAKTVEAAWRRRFNKPPPDVGEVGGDGMLGDLMIEHSTAGLLLNAVIQRNLVDSQKPAYRFRIEEVDFK